MALIDSTDGTVYPAPFSILGDGIAIATFEGGGKEPMISYKLNSRLLIVRGCPEDTNCASYFYEWTGRGLKLIRKIPATMGKR